MRRVLAVLAAAAAALSAQALSGVIDIHAHADPDSLPRSIDALALARLARARGMRGLVLKNHYEPTAGLAWLARQQAPGLEVFGGIALNRAVGGINPAAVEHMVHVKGGYGRFVWMPTFDAENQVRADGAQRPFVPVARDGRLRPEVLAVLDLVAKHGLVLETGHSSPAECLLLIEAARARGIRRIVVTHAMVPPVRMNIAEMKQAAGAGAYVEFVYNALVSPNHALDIKDYAAAIRAVGTARCILASDLGQAANPPHPEGLVEFFRLLREHGFTGEEIGRMARENPAALLGLR